MECLATAQLQIFVNTTCEISFEIFMELAPANRFG